jgi:adenylate kinase
MSDLNNAVFLFFGPPGAGKGTLASVVAPDLNLEHVSTGDMFRAEAQSGSELGEQLKQIMDSGKLVPDALTIEIVKKKMLSLGQKGIILDGFPRTVDQAAALDEMLKDIGKKVDLLVYLDVSTEVIKKRLLGRLVCQSCGENFNEYFKPPQQEGVCDVCQGKVYKRTDDTEESIEQRLGQYQQKTAPVKEYYEKQGLTRDFNADRGVMEIKDELVEALKSSFQK